MFPGHPLQLSLCWALICALQGEGASCGVTAPWREAGTERAWLARSYRPCLASPPHYLSLFVPFQWTRKPTCLEFIQLLEANSHPKAEQDVRWSLGMEKPLKEGAGRPGASEPSAAAARCPPYSSVNWSLSPPRPPQETQERFSKEDAETGPGWGRGRVFLAELQRRFFVLLCFCLFVFSLRVSRRSPSPFLTP